MMFSSFESAALIQVEQPRHLHQAARPARRWRWIAGHRYVEQVRAPR